MDELPIVDAHHHFWDLKSLYYPWLMDKEPHEFFLGDYAAIRRVYLPPDLRRDAARHNLVASVHVEAECSREQQVAESRWLTKVAGEHGLPTAIVAHAWFDVPDAEAILAEQASFPLVRGIRSKPVTTAKPGQSVAGQKRSMQHADWLAGYKLLGKYNLSWDLRVPFWHLEEAAKVAGDHPHIPVVLNHTGFPWDRSPEGLALWRQGMRALARQPNVHCKLSCLCLREGPWTLEGNRPIVLETIDIFGAGRCMFASNFPVDSVRIGYDAMFTAFKAMVKDFSPGEQRGLFHDNAKRFYRLP